jgi:hypothetical protein
MHTGMTETQIDVFKRANSKNLNFMTAHYNERVSGLRSFERFDVVELILKFERKGYLLGDYLVMADVKSLYYRFDILILLNEISETQWEVRMPDLREIRLIKKTY